MYICMFGLPRRYTTAHVPFLQHPWRYMNIPHVLRNGLIKSRFARAIQGSERPDLCRTRAIESSSQRESCLSRHQYGCLGNTEQGRATRSSIRSGFGPNNTTSLHVNIIWYGPRSMTLQSSRLLGISVGELPFCILMKRAFLVAGHESR